MRVAMDSNMAIAWMPTKLVPPQLVGTFLCKAAFPIVNGAPDAHVIQASGDVTTEDGIQYPSDFVPYKPRADVLVRASAHVPSGQSAPYLQVGFEVGRMRKMLLVAGDRSWQRGILGRSPGEPKPFASMPITWNRAFGGPKDRANPIGRGREGDSMPNIEIPGRLLQGPDARIPAAGFGPIAANWQPRLDLVGSYGGNYLKTRWPWYPEDFDFGHFNSAPRDQQVEGYLRGDETFTFENLHRNHSKLEGKLPSVRSRVFLTFASGEFREVAQRLDTLFCDLLEDRLILVWRGHTPIETPTMHEVVHVLAVLEPLEQPHDAEHYLALRERKQASVVEPQPDSVEAAADAEHEAALTAKVALMEAELVQGEAEMDAEAAAREHTLFELGIDPALLSTPAQLQHIVAQQADLARLTQTPPPEILQAKPVAAEPAMTAEEAAELEQLEAEFEAEKASLREPSAWTRDRLLAAVATNMDLQGEDLSGLDLSGCALAGARLDGASFAGCNFERADLRGTSFRGAVLQGANLGHADLTGAILDGADCTSASLAGARLAGASLARTILVKQNLAGLDLSGCRGEAVRFAGADLRNCKLTGAAFPKGDFSGSKLAGADCTGLDLQNARLHAADAHGANFQRAMLRGMRGDDGCSLADADFRHANLDGVVIEFGNLHGADLRYASVRNALLTGTDLGQCDLSRADFERSSLADANLTGARLLQTNLRYASLERCEMKGADARQANFYGAGFWETKTELCDLREAILASTLLALR